MDRRALLRALAASGSIPLVGCNADSDERTSDGPPPDRGDPTTRTPTGTLTPSATAGERAVASTTDVGSTRTVTSNPTESPDSGRFDTAIAGDHSQTGDEFGAHIATADETVLVAAPGEKHADSEQNRGAVYAFERVEDRWEQQAKLVPESTDAPYDFTFGTAVALEDDTAVVGALESVSSHVVPRGHAYVYQRQRDEWKRPAILAHRDSDRDGFGRSVALSGESVLVGAPYRRGSTGERFGAARVFSRTGEEPRNDPTATTTDGDRVTSDWAPVATLTPENPVTNSYFGISVGLDGDTALVGARNYQTPDGENIGLAYVFTNHDGEWRQREMLAPESQHDHEDDFGNAVTLDGGVALVGSRGDDDPNGLHGGSAYLFDRSDGTWQQEAKLVPTDGDGGYSFGSDVAFSGGKVLVGAADAGESSAGAAYLFERVRGEWLQQSKLAYDRARPGDQYGRAVSLTAEWALVGGSGGDTEAMHDSGEVAVFTA